VPYLNACEVVFHEEALYQVYVPLPLPYLYFTCCCYYNVLLLFFVSPAYSPEICSKLGQVLAGRYSEGRQTKNVSGLQVQGVL